MFSFGLHDAQPAKKALPPPSKSVTDEDVQKRNTDCIYFLASPLTCKKAGLQGTNCEYRHSEAARLNPRDCRFWKAGNCLNPRCSFRHLPLDEKSASAASIASTSSAPIISQLVAATSSSNKSQTPCYFFSQGYCAKNDKCPFMHGLSAAPGGDTDTQKNLAAELNSKAGYGRPVAANGSYTLSKVPMTLQEIPQKSNGLGKSTSFESNKTYVKSGAPLKFRKPMVQVDRPYDAEQSQLGQQRLQHKGDNDGMFVHPNNFRQGNAWTGDPYAFQSDSHPIMKSPNNSVGSNGRASLEQSRSDGSEELSEEVLQSHAFRGHLQASSKYASDPRVTAHDKPEKFGEQKMSLEKDASTDLRNHLMKRQKINGFLAVSQKVGIRGYTGITTSCNGSQKRTEDHHAHQQEGKLLAKAVKTEGKVAKSDGTESSMPLQKVSMNGTSSTDKCPTQGNNRHEASGGSSIREVATFMGPKSLAQIKAEKMASASKLLGKDNSRTITAEAGTKLAARKLELHIGVSSDKHIAITKSALKENTATLAEFEGPKPLSMLLKRKRELDSDSDSRDTMPVPHEAEVLMPCQTEVSMPVKAEPLKAVVSMPDTSEELEDGEVGYESVGFLQESLPSPSCLFKEHVEVMSAISTEVLQRAGVELAESEMESLEDGSKSDAEMEDIDYDDAGCGIIDEDDDDDDFAKKLGRYFTFTSN